MMRLPKRVFFQLLHVQFPHAVDVSAQHEIVQHADSTDFDYNGWAPLNWCIDRFGVKNIASGTIGSRKQLISGRARRSYCGSAPYVAMRGTTIRFKHDSDAALCKLLFG